MLYRKTYAVVLADVKAFVAPIPIVNVRGGMRVTLKTENAPDRFGELEGEQISPGQPKVAAMVGTPVAEVGEAEA